MPHSDVVERISSAPRRLPLRSLWIGCCVVPVVAVLGVLATHVFVDVPTVDRVTFVNRTVYATDVSVTDARRDGWLGLGTLERGATTVVADVADQDDVWIIDFRSQGLDGGELRLTKDDLARASWWVVIPDAIGQRLAGQGAAPTPGHETA